MFTMYNIVECFILYYNNIISSVNEVICHGIPDKRELENGDICNGKPLTCSLIRITPYFLVDITVYRGGFHGDLNETMFVGKPSEKAQKIVTTAYECMMKGIGIGKKNLSLYLLSNYMYMYMYVSIL